MANVWQCGKFQLDTTTPVIMGILNVTPDSFHDGGEFVDPELALTHAKEMVEQGAGIVDVGAQSTRPGHTKLTPEQELERLEKVLPELVKLPVPVSVDTYYPQVAQWCLETGASIINDVSGVINTDMLSLVARFGAGYVAMHTGFTSDIAENMAGADMTALDTETPIDTQVTAFFDSVVSACHLAGVGDDQLCLDVGIGFGKSQQQNELLLSYSAPDHLKKYPLLMGVSHKRITRALFGEDTLLGTLKCNEIARSSGFSVFRVHDVKEHHDWVKSHLG